MKGSIFALGSPVRVMRNNEKETHDSVGTVLGKEMCYKAAMTASAIPISRKTLKT